MMKRTRQADLHLTDDEVLDLAYGEESAEVREWWEVHRQECKKCADAVEMTRAAMVRETEMPLERLSPAETRNVLDRLTSVLTTKAPAPAERQGLLLAYWDWVKEHWKLWSILPPEMAFRGRDIAEAANVVPLAIDADPNGGISLRVDLGEDYAGARVRLTGSSAQAVAVLDAEGRAVLTLPPEQGASLKLWLVEE